MGDAGSACRVIVDRDYVIGEVDPRLCGSFVEHLGRVVYTGIYEPGHPQADADGFRTDVQDLVRELGVTVVRYPGGNFVSGYDWRDGIGPRERRTPKLDLAWQSLETNEFGLNEFMSWCEKLGIEPFLVFNLGTQGVQSACEMVEYCNGTAGSAMAQLRRSHGRDAPYGVRLWGLGNEMDGSWQIGSRSASEYGSLAAQVARAVKRVDESAQLVVAGSSLRSMASFPDWDRVVLEHTYDAVDYLALHQYYPADVLDEQSFAASGYDFEQYIRAGLATCDYVRELKRARRSLNISMDEWNVNYRAEEGERVAWEVAPRIAEFQSSCRDAVVFGGLLIPLLRHADRVKIACQSLLVNVGGSIRTEPGASAVKQAIFGPMAAVFNAVQGRAVLGVAIDGPEVATQAYGDVPAIDASAVIDPEGTRLTLFAINRSTAQSIDLKVILRGWDAIGSATCRTLIGTRQRGEAALVPTDMHVVAKDAGQVRLGPMSWAEVAFALS